MTRKLNPTLLVVAPVHFYRLVIIPRGKNQIRVKRRFLVYKKQIPGSKSQLNIPENFVASIQRLGKV